MKSLPLHCKGKETGHKGRQRYVHNACGMPKGMWNPDNHIHQYHLRGSLQETGSVIVKLLSNKILNANTATHAGWWEL